MKTRLAVLKAVLAATGVLACLGAQAGSPFAFEAQAADESISDQLQRVESTLGMSQGSQSIIERLQAVEQRMYGSATQPGRSLLDRLNRVKADLAQKDISQKDSWQKDSWRQAPPAVPASPPVNQAGSQQKERIVALLKQANLTRNVITPNTFPPHYFRIEPASLADSQKTGDYFDQVMEASKNRVFKFERMPVPIYITGTRDPGYSAAVLAACGDWERRTGGAVKFVPVGQTQAARIRVTWSHLGNKPTSESNLGAHTMTKWVKKPSGRVSVLSVGAIPLPLYIPSGGPKYTVPPQVVEVNLDLVDSKDAEIRYLTLRNIISHELGHALGMLGHSPVKGDLMFPVTDEHSRISERDLATFRKLYEKKATVPL